MDEGCRRLNFGDDEDDGAYSAKMSTTHDEVGVSRYEVGLPMDKEDWTTTKKRLEQFVSDVGSTDTPWMLEPYRSDKLVNCLNTSSFDVKLSTTTYRVICALALEMDCDAMRASIYGPVEGKPVIISQRQAASIAACAFLDLFPLPSRRMDAQHLTLRFWENELEKLRCIANYFKVIRQRLEEDPNWTGSYIGFYRRHLPAREYSKQSDWTSARAPLTRLILVNGEDASIELSKNSLQADFANEYIGGGVLHGGCVQEEIRFTISPECLCSMLLCDVMGPADSILIRGTEIYSHSTGYAWTFQFDSRFVDDTDIDSDGFRNNWLTALDAIPYIGHKECSQFKSHNVIRDLRKCLAATIVWPGEHCDELQPFATGNWGCGAFGGDPELKSVQQWLACSIAGRDVRYVSRRSSWPGLQALIDAVETHNGQVRAASPSSSSLPLSNKAIIDVGYLSKLLFDFEPVKVADESASLFTFLLAKIKEKV